MSARDKWIVILAFMALGAYIGGAYRGRTGAVLGALATGLVVSAILVPARDRHIKP